MSEHLLESALKGTGRKPFSSGGRRRGKWFVFGEEVNVLVPPKMRLGTVRVGIGRAIEAYLKSIGAETGLWCSFRVRPAPGAYDQAVQAQSPAMLVRDEVNRAGIPGAERYVVAAARELRKYGGLGGRRRPRRG